MKEINVVIANELVEVAERIKIENEMSSYTKEKFYKSGFYDAIRLILKEII